MAKAKNGKNSKKPKANGVKKRKRTRINVSSSVNGGSRPMPFMHAMENKRPLINSTFVERGSDFIGTVTVKPGSMLNSPSDRILAEFPVSPSFYPGTRITTLANLYERFRFRNYRVRYVPAVAVSVACQLLGYIDLDPLDDPRVIPSVEDLLRQATAQTGSQQWNFNLPKCIPMAKRADRIQYYTGLDKQNERFTQQGKFVLLQVTAPSDFNGSPTTEPIEAGSLYIDWDIEFQTGQINPNFIGQAYDPQITGNQTTAAGASTVTSVSGPAYWLPTASTGTTTLATVQHQTTAITNEPGLVFDFVYTCTGSTTAPTYDTIDTSSAFSVEAFETQISGNQLFVIAKYRKLFKGPAALALKVNKAATDTVNTVVSITPSSGASNSQRMAIAYSKS